jgi:hypothetical protein
MCLPTNLKEPKMDNSFTSISALLDHGNNGFIGFGYGQIKSSAEYFAKAHGCEWAKKYPSTQEAEILRRKIRNIVISKTPENHSNKDVVWKRFRQYALEYCGQ